jgi:glycerol-3-phosphate dehydrogenase
MTNSIREGAFDVAVIGGGINGAVAAARLSAAGYSVILLDRGDFGGVTSQESSNLVWGGIKYLQTFEFGLVYKLCRSRNQLLDAYPHRIQQVGFLASLGPKAPFGPVLGFMGALVYWAIGMFRTQPPRVVKPATASRLEPHFVPDRPALEYFDAYLPDNDSRFVWDFIRTSREFGATCLNYHEVTAAQFDTGWTLDVTDRLSQSTHKVSAGFVVNAAGPFAPEVNNILGITASVQLMLSKGVHLVVRKIHTSNRVLAFWDEQGRMFYVLPMHDRSVIGTTDTRVGAETKTVTDDDREFLLRQINNEMRLGSPLTEKDIIAERCGVRPLVSEGQIGDVADWHKLSRKHVIEGDRARRVVSVFGGKLTDCLNVGDEILQNLEKCGLPRATVSRRWFGEEPAEQHARFVRRADKFFSGREEKDECVSSLWRRHGSRAHDILDMIEKNQDLARSPVPSLGICAAEIAYVIENEMVKTPEDLTRRRLPIEMLRGEREIVHSNDLNELWNTLSTSLPSAQ